MITDKQYRDLLDKYEDNRSNFVKTYSYRPNCKRDFDRKLDYNINYLYGLIKKFNYVDTISYNYFKLIEKWYYENKYQNNHPLIKNILLKVSYILNNNNLSKKEIRLIIQSFRPIKRSPEYQVSILKLQVLKGILDSILCEDFIEEYDKEYLKNWMKIIKINDKEYKKFYKEIDWDDEELKDYLNEYSMFLKEYLG